MASWSEFAAAEPDLAAAIRALFQQYGPGMGYLATVRPDGGPRVHPVSPVLTDEGLYCFIVDSPKRHDLERDGRYALHSYPPEDSDDEAYLTGRAHLVTDQATVNHLADALRASPRVDWRLFELSIETAMLRRHGPAGALPLATTLRYPPITLKWLAAGPATSGTSTTRATLTTPTIDPAKPAPTPPPVDADIAPCPPAATAHRAQPTAGSPPAAAARHAEPARLHLRAGVPTVPAGLGRPAHPAPHSSGRPHTPDKGLTRASESEEDRPALSDLSDKDQARTGEDRTRTHEKGGTLQTAGVFLQDLAHATTSA
ncbi:hypothetical protein GCM10010166_13730 [Couchioplanes caeruleus subsp. azureus]|nr:hypothetical protein GCM10010166_13730 [Couchioplanes caeruleus subsp. azureus]